jgi:hypothetical protein
VVDLPGPHHLPPPDFAERELPTISFTQPWLRLHAVGRSARYWGINPIRRVPARWDDPDHSYGVLYVGTDEHAAFIETFGHNTGLRVIQSEDLASRGLSRIVVHRPVRLVPITGPFLAKLGVDARLFTSDYSIAQSWSKAFHDHPSAPDGIYYPARHDETRMCAALFSRIAELVTEEPLGTLADSPHALLLGTLLRTYGFGLL